MGAGVPRLIALLAAAGTALTNSTTETVLTSYALVTGVPLAAYSFQVGKSYRIRGSVRATATNSTDTLRVRLRIGPTTLTGTVVADSTAVDVADNDLFIFDVTVTCRAVGSTGEILIAGSASVIGVEGTATMRTTFERITSFDTTSAQRIEVTGVWSVASASNSCQAESFSVEEAA